MASREQKVALGRKQLSKFQQKKRDSASAPQASNSNNNNNDQPEIQPVLEPAESDSPTAVPLAESPSLTTIDAISPEASRLEYLEKLANTLYSENHSLIATIQRLQSQVNLSDNEKAAVQRQLKLMETQITNNRNAEMERIRSALEAEQKHSSQLQSELTDLQGQHANIYARESQAAAAEIQRLKENLSESAKERDLLRKELEERQRECVSLEEAARMSTGKSEQMESQVNGYKQTITQLNAQISQLTAELEERGKHSAETSAQHSESIDRYNSEIASLKQQINTLHQQNDQLEKSSSIAIQEASSLKENLQSQANNFCNELNAKDEEIRRLKASLSDTAESLSQLDILRKEAAQQNEDLMRSNALLNEKLSQLVASESYFEGVLKDQKMALEQKNQEYGEGFKSLQSQLSQVSQSLQTVTEERDNVRLELLNTQASKERILQAIRESILPDIDVNDASDSLYTQKLKEWLVANEKQLLTIGAERQSLQSMISAADSKLCSLVEYVKGKSSLLKLDDIRYPDDSKDISVKLEFISNLLQQFINRPLECFAETEREVAELSSKINSLQTQLISANSTIERYQEDKGKLDSLTGSMDDLKSRLMSIEGLVGDLEAFIVYDFSGWTGDDVEALVAILLTNMQQHLVQATVKEKYLFKKAEMLESSLRESQKTAQTCREKKELALADVEELKSRNNVLEQQLHSMKEALEDITNQWKHACEVVKGQKSKLDSLNDQISQLKLALSEETRRRADAEEKLAALTSENATTADLIARERQLYADLEHLLEKEKETSLHLSEHLAAARADNERLKGEQKYLAEAKDSALSSAQSTSTEYSNVAFNLMGALLDSLGETTELLSRPLLSTGDNTTLPTDWGLNSNQSLLAMELEGMKQNILLAKSKLTEESKNCDFTKFAQLASHVSRVDKQVVKAQREIMANRIQSTVKAAERIGEFEEALGRAEETIRILEQEVARKSSVIDSLQQDLARLEAREQRANIAEELQSPVSDPHLEKICQQTGQTIQVIDELVRISTAHQKHLCSDAESVAVNEQAYSEKMETMRQIVDELFQIKISADSISNNPEYSSAIKLMQAHIKQLKRVWQCEVNSNRILQSLLSEHKANIRDFREQQQLNSDRLKSDIVNQELKDALFRERKELSAQRSSFLELKAIWDSERSDLTNDNESLREMLRIQYSEAEMSRRGRLEAEKSLYDLQKEYKSLEESLFEVKKKNREDREDLLRRFKSKLLEMKAIDHSEGIHDDHAMLWRERETHHQHCKQLMKEFSILKLKYKRVSGYRADLVFQKQYLLSVAGSLIDHVPFTVDSKTRGHSRRRLLVRFRIAAITVISACRMKLLSSKFNNK